MDAGCRQQNEEKTNERAKKKKRNEKIEFSFNWQWQYSTVDDEHRDRHSEQPLSRNSLTSHMGFFLFAVVRADRSSA